MGIVGFGGLAAATCSSLRNRRRKCNRIWLSAGGIEKLTVEAEAGGGMAKVVMSGDRRVNEIKIKKEAVDPDDIEMLEDLIIAALNEASCKVDELSEELMGPYAGMLG